MYVLGCRRVCVGCVGGSVCWVSVVCVGGCVEGCV